MQRDTIKAVLLCGVLLASLALYWTVFILKPEFHRNYLQGEDRVVEWLTFVFFLTGSVLAFLILAYRRTMSKQMIVYFLALGVFLLVCAGEEISWGQRVLGFETPENMMTTNEQKEFNLHNMKMKHIHPQGIFSFLMSLYGILLPVVFWKELSDENSPKRRYISPLVLVPCFLFPVILGPAGGYVKSQIVLYSNENIVVQYGNLTKELREMYWGFGVFLSTMMLFRINRRSRSS
jgi:hypothetical protein